MARSLVLVIFVISLLVDAANAGEPRIISQKGKKFSPSELQLAVGETIHIENDDRVLHHVYVESPDFNFDSGEQPPGRRISITFTIRGIYEVRCDIHPKMRLRVSVR